MRALLAVLLLASGLAAADVVVLKGRRNRAWPDIERQATEIMYNHSAVVWPDTTLDTRLRYVPLVYWRWPDSVRVETTFNARFYMIDTLRLSKGSVESLAGPRRIWWSGGLFIEDSVIVPGRYRVSGDSLLK